MARLLTPRSGTVLLDGRSVHGMPTRQLGILPQSPAAPEGLIVVDLVTRGRSPHQSWWPAVVGRRRDRCGGGVAGHRLDRALRGPARAGLDRDGHRPGDADPAPRRATTFLDLAHQNDVLDLVVDLNRREDRTVVMVLHDLNQACRHADHMIAMKSGRIVTQGPPAEVISPEVVAEVFDAAATVHTGVPAVASSRRPPRIACGVGLSAAPCPQQISKRASPRHARPAGRRGVPRPWGASAQPSIVVFAPRPPTSWITKPIDRDLEDAP
jgi:hypothetical protein